MSKPLDQAQELLEAMWFCHADRLKRGDLSEWHTELNEVHRVLEYLIEHLKAPPAVYVLDESDLDDTHL